MEILPETLEALKRKGLPRVKIEDVRPRADLPEEAAEEAQRYFDGFAWTPGFACPNCGGDIAKGHVPHPHIPGEAECGECGYPCRSEHAVAGLVVHRFFLPYHPSELVYRNRGERVA
jgi:hypothetical protein